MNQHNMRNLHHVIYTTNSHFHNKIIIKHNQLNHGVVVPSHPKLKNHLLEKLIIFHMI